MEFKNVTEQFVFTGRLKKICFSLIIIGIIAVGIDLAISSMGSHDAHIQAPPTQDTELLKHQSEHPAESQEHKTDVEHHQPGMLERIFANLLLNSYYLVWMGLAGLFFIAIQYVANAGWSAGIKRIPEAFSAILPWAGGFMLIVVSLGLLNHTLYHHWADPAVTDPGSAKFDPIIAGKSALLNVPFFMFRLVFFFIIWIIFQQIFRKYSLKEDMEQGINLKWFDKNVKLSAIYIPVFALTFCLAAFDWIMSLEPHWFSTMFAVYNFASMWVSGLAAITLVYIILKEQGYLSFMNENHLHDLGKFIFAFSIFWTYIWLGQFLLIWYANLPEEVVYFDLRWKPEYKLLFWINLVMNWTLPMLILMTRDAKRSFKVLKYVCVLVIVGHWLDLYLMIMPGTMGAARKIGLLEIGTFLSFAGFFAYIMFTSLSKAPLVAKNHPYLEESLHHEI